MMSKQNLLRVEQINAIFLDKEIYKVLRHLLQDATKNLPPTFIVPLEPELQLILHLSLILTSVVRNDSTFGQQLLSIKYKNIYGIQKILYPLGYCFDYVKAKCEWWNPSHKINNIFYRIDLIRKVLDFINLSIFLRKGSKPLLIERLLCLEQVYAKDNVQRQYTSKYLARELLWSGFIEILVYVIPLINFHKLKRTVKRYNPFHRPQKYSTIQNRHMTIYSKCAYCGENPILPYHMGCAHIFCYVCLKGNQAADPYFECPLCEHKNPNILCDRVIVI